MKLSKILWMDLIHASLHMAKQGLENHLRTNLCNYRMMGEHGSKRGIIPRLLSDIFDSLIDNTTEDAGLSRWNEVLVSYFEIYNEKVIDLFGKQECRVREHPSKGPYVENLTKCLFRLI